MSDQPVSDPQATGSSADAGRPGTESTSAAINVEQLAEKVYQLLRQEARLSLARGQRGPGHPLTRGR
ncbi:hypothetical protein [Thermogemmatispora sp.]|uniref:hypothetical protein n=1 Tax=Thermogemmatispora sp. TaxID=1968838 RepID=UPI0035E40CD0